jgi:hypothetical protein
MRKTTVVVEIEYSEDLRVIDVESITETFDEGGDMDWKVNVVSVETKTV